MSDMWNRVVLLTCGMALGWGLANYWAAAWEDLGKHRYRLIASGAIGLLLIASLAWEQLGSGLVALGMLVGSAAVSYAANARQMGKPVASLDARPEAPPREARPPAVILVAEAEPAGYTGPSPWAERLRQEPKAGRHWLLRPYLCHRVRIAYRQMPEGPPSWQALQWLAAQAQERLGTGADVQIALVWGEPSLRRRLRNLVEEGHDRLVILPVDVEPDRGVDLRQIVVDSRIREVGVAVEVLPTWQMGLWDEARSRANLELLLRGQPLTEMRMPEPAACESLVGQLMAEL